MREPHKAWPLDHVLQEPSERQRLQRSVRQEFEG